MAAALTLIKVSGYAEEVRDGDERARLEADEARHDRGDAFAGNAVRDLDVQDAIENAPEARIDIDSLLSRPDVWRGRATAQHATLPTGQSALDAMLPGGGWPLGALTEICCAQQGVGEMALLLPALARMARAQRWIAFVDSPLPIYGPGLVQAGVPLKRVLTVEGGEARAARRPTRHGATHHGAWAAEQMLRGGACGAAVLWLPQYDDDRPLRRLQLAAEASQGFGVVLRPLEAASRTSPAAVRLRIDEGRRVRLFKCRGLNVSPGSARVVSLDDVSPGRARVVSLDDVADRKTAVHSPTDVIPANAGIQRLTH